MTTLVNIIILSFIGSVLGFLGGLALIWKESFARKYSLFLISFAAGVILAISFLDVLPGAYEQLGKDTFLVALIGMVVFFLTENFILHTHHHQGDEHPLDTSVVPLLVISDSVHNFIDGVVIAASYLVDPKLGLIVALATLFHEIPKETGDFAVLLSAGYSKLKAIMINLATAAISLVGSVLTYFLTDKIQNLNGPLLGLAAGMFLYIAAADILPRLIHGQKKEERWKVASIFVLGVFVMFVLTKLVPD